MVHSKNKGKRGELDFSKELTWVIDCIAQRGRQYHGRQDAPDVHTDIEGIHFEVKRTERFNLYDALDQATEDAGDDVPVVAHRRNKRPWVLVVTLDDLPRFVAILKDKMRL